MRYLLQRLEAWPGPGKEQVPLSAIFQAAERLAQDVDTSVAILVIEAYPPAAEFLK